MIGLTMSRYDKAQSVQSCYVDSSLSWLGWKYGIMIVSKVQYDITIELQVCHHYVHNKQFVIMITCTQCDIMIQNTVNRHD